MMSHDNYLFECNSIKFAFPQIYEGATELRSLSCTALGVLRSVHRATLSLQPPAHACP